MKKILLFSTCVLLSNLSQGQVVTPEQERAIDLQLEKMTVEEHRAMNRLLFHKNANIKKNNSPSQTIKATDNSANVLMSGSNYTNVRFPGEFEEVQGIFITWPTSWAGTIDTSANGNASVYRQMVKAIQEEPGVKVYININSPSDSTKLKTHLLNNNIPMTNYQFLVYESDAFWVRDYGPINFYYGDQDSIGWLDLQYYTNREKDNNKPNEWAAELNIPIVSTSLKFEGGNVLQDGNGTLFTTQKVVSSNSPLSSNQVVDTLKKYFKADNVHLLKVLPNDGGTGHIDLAYDMTDEASIVRTKYPEVMDNVWGFSDYDTATANLAYLSGETNIFGKPYYIDTIPFPTKDNGSYYSTGYEYGFFFTRTYSNHLIMNNTILQPVFSDESSGNRAGDSLALVAIKAAYPGYRIVPIDMRSFDGMGGSIHCITKEFAAENPIFIKHFPYKKIQEYQSNYPVDAVIKNKSGISTAQVLYRRKGTDNWTTVSLNPEADNHFVGQIPSNNTTDTIEYYIKATSNNGKTITKPFPGANGPYTYYYSEGTTSIDNTIAKDLGIGNLYPNPSKDFVNLELQPKSPNDVQLSIVDMSGKVHLSKRLGKIVGQHKATINTEYLATGLYFIQVFVENQLIGVRKLIKE